MDIWERRRKHLRALIAYKGLNGAQVADRSGLSVNTVNKFLKGDTQSLKWSSLEAICNALDLVNPAVLDSDNPFSEAKNQLYSIVSGMSDDEARAAIADWEARKTGA